MINGDAIKFIREKEKVLPNLKSKVLKLEVKKKRLTKDYEKQSKKLVVLQN